MRQSLENRLDYVGCAVAMDACADPDSSREQELTRIIDRLQVLTNIAEEAALVSQHVADRVLGREPEKDGAEAGCMEPYSSLSHISMQIDQLEGAVRRAMRQARRLNVL